MWTMTHEVNATAGSLLGFLHEGEMTGWDLAQRVEATIGNFWNVTRSQIYRELRALEGRGLVTAGEAGRRERRPYALTDSGRDAFAAWIAKRPGPELIRMPVLLAVFFGRHLPDETLTRFLTARRIEDEDRLAAYRQLLPLVESDPYIAATIKFGIAYRQTVLDWLDELPWSEPR
jgi:DNA-binding PadR family transcriptional regulator